MSLNKPDTNKPIFRMFPELANDVLNNRCPVCKKLINADDFKDALSLKEYSISGMCFECQEAVFG